MNIKTHVFKAFFVCPSVRPGWSGCAAKNFQRAVKKYKKVKNCTQKRYPTPVLSERPFLLHSCKRQTGLFPGAPPSLILSELYNPAQVSPGLYHGTKLQNLPQSKTWAPRHRGFGAPETNKTSVSNNIQKMNNKM